MFRQLVPFLFAAIIGCAGGNRVATPVAVAPAPKSVPVATPTPVASAFTAPPGWSTIQGEGFVFAVPRTVKEVETDDEDAPAFAGKTADDKFIMGFDFKPGMRTVKRHSAQLLESLSEINADIKKVMQIEIDESDGIEVLAIQGDTVFLIFAFVKDKVGYQLSCGTSVKGEGTAMVAACEAIAETFKFTK